MGSPKSGGRQQRSCSPPARSWKVSLC